MTKQSVVWWKSFVFTVFKFEISDSELVKSKSQAVWVWEWMFTGDHKTEHTFTHLFPHIPFLIFLFPPPFFPLFLSARHSCHPLPSALNVSANLRHHLQTYPLEYEHLKEALLQLLCHHQVLNPQQLFNYYRLLIINLLISQNLWGTVSIR